MRPFILVILLSAFGCAQSFAQGNAPDSTSIPSVTDSLAVSSDSTASLVSTDSLGRNSLNSFSDALQSDSTRAFNNLGDSTSTDSTAQDSTSGQQAVGGGTLGEEKNERDSVDYGPNTTTFLYKEDVYFNRLTGHFPDTLLDDFQRYNYIQRFENTRQNLGNLGTANQSIFYEPPPDIGTRWGINLYESYLLRPNQTKYFNSLSPYTDIELIQGGQGRSHLSVDFSRNINPEWNITLLYRRMSTNRVVRERFSRNDPQFLHQTIGANMRYFTPNRRYKLLAFAAYYDHEVQENGGLHLGDQLFDDIDTLFQVGNADLEPELSNVVSLQYGREANLYHQYSLAKGGEFELFHDIHYSEQTNSYRDNSFSSHLSYYDTTYFDSLATREIYSTRFGSLQNKGGIKGRSGKFQYRAYLKHRTYNYGVTFMKDTVRVDSVLNNIPLTDEIFAGGGFRLDLDENKFLNFSAEYMLAGEYRAEVHFEHPRFNARASRYFYSPSVVQRRHYGNHHRWDENFDNITANVLSASYRYDVTDSLWVRPFVRLTNVSDLVFNDTDGIARQGTDSSVTLLSGGFRVKGKWQFWRYEAHFMYSRHLGSELIRVPEFFFNGKFYYERAFFGKALYGQIGLDMHWTDQYYADAYVPGLQRFRLQNEQLVGNFFNADAFFNFKVNRFMAFLKINNLLQDAVGPGYFTTPYYTAQTRSFEVGIKWLFFD